MITNALLPGSSNTASPDFLAARAGAEIPLAASSKSVLLQRCSAIYAGQLKKIWRLFPSFLRPWPLGGAYGRHLHAQVCRSAKRNQYFATFFLRNRPELELIRRLANQRPRGSELGLTVLACSKGAEVYSVAWALRCSRPDLRLKISAVDLSQEILEFAKKGTYALRACDASSTSVEQESRELKDIACNTYRDQNAPIFERMTPEELQDMFDVEGDLAHVKPFLREGISWQCGDASDPKIVSILGLQDIVMANRFLCHMEPATANSCLRNIARLVKPGGYLFVSGVDLDVRTKVAKDLGWHPVLDLLKEVHEGDASLRQGWPLEYWGLEPFFESRPDWKIRYASVFRIGEANSNAA